MGLFCSTPAVAVGRSVQRKVAMEMLITGHPLCSGYIKKNAEKEKKKVKKALKMTSQLVIFKALLFFFRPHDP